MNSLDCPLSETVTIAALFGDGQFYRIPEYQRTYSWTETQVNLLFSDLLREMEKDSKAGGRRNCYFLGSIIIVSREQPLRAEIADGQQRLLTIMTLIAVLRDIVGDADGLRLDALIRQPGGEEASPRYRIESKPLDQAFLGSYVLAMGATGRSAPGYSERPQAAIGGGAEAIGGELEEEVGLTEAQEKIISNRDLLREKAIALLEGQRQDLIEFLLNQCALVRITASDPNKACRVFSVLHTRGMPLSFTDILKADLLDGLDDVTMRRCARAWEAAETRLGQQRFIELFRQIHLIETGEHLDDSEAITGFHKGCNPLADRVGFIDGKLVPLANALRQVRDAQLDGFSADDSVNRRLVHLNWINGGGWVSAVLVWLHLNGYRRHQVEPFLFELERFAYGLFILHPHDEPRLRRRYIDVIQAIRQNPGGTPKAAFTLTDKERRDIIERLSTMRVYDKADCLPLLLRINAIDAGAGDKYRFKLNEVTAEHILPKNGNKHWNAIFKRYRGPSSAGFVSGLLGNLVPLSEADNSELGQAPFHEKRKVYELSEFASTRKLSSLVDWTPELLEQRTRHLADRLITEWRL